MEEDIEYIELFELYKGLLTKTQIEMFNSHFCMDLSLKEVADEVGTSRQSVYDAIKKVKAKLKEYEGVLHLKEKNDRLTELAGCVEDVELKNKITEIRNL